jgi:hypothetical protein
MGRGLEGGQILFLSFFLGKVWKWKKGLSFAVFPLLSGQTTKKVGDAPTLKDSHE